MTVNFPHNNCKFIKLRSDIKKKKLILSHPVVHNVLAK